MASRIRVGARAPLGVVLLVASALRLLSGPSVVRADIPVELKGRPVVAVTISGGTEGITEPREMGIPLGVPLSRQLLRSAVKRVLESGRWADVQFDVVATRGGVEIIAHLVPKLSLARIELRGNEVVDDGLLRRALGVSEDGELRREELEAMADAVVEVYRERGYLSAVIEMHIRDTDDPFHKVLIVDVEEGPVTRISALRFEGEAPPTASGATNVMNLAVGERLDKAQIEEAVRAGERRLRNRGWLEARLGPVRFEREGAGMAVIVPSVVGPAYRVLVKGAYPLDESQVIETLRLKEERVTGASFEAMRQRVMELYRRHGFYDVSATVESRLALDGDTRLLVVTVEPGPSLEVVSVLFPGARHFSRSFLRDQVASYLQEELGELTIFEPVDPHTIDQLGVGGGIRGRGRTRPPPLRVDPTRVYYEPTYEKAIEHLRELYDADGYLSAGIGPQELKLLKDHNAIVVIPVVEGPRSMLSSVEVRHNKALTSQEILLAAGFKRGMPFSYLSLEQARAQIEARYKERGYYYARVESKVRFSGDRTRAKVILDIIERFPVVVGDVVVTGLTRTRESLVRERLALRPGTLFTPEAVRESQDSLNSLDVFSGVHIAPEDADLPARVKTIVVTVTERKPQSIELRVGVSTGEGVRGAFEYGYGNLGGRAIGIRLRVQLAHRFFFLGEELDRKLSDLSLADRLERLVNLSATFPNVRIPKARASVDLFHQRDNERQFGIDKAGAGVSLNLRPLRQLTFSFTQEFEFNNVDLFVDVDSIEDLILEIEDRRLQRTLRVPEGWSWLAATRGSVRLDMSDHPFTPTRGFRAAGIAEWARTLQTEKIEHQDASPTRFRSNHVKLTASATGYVPLGEHTVFATQLRVGRIFHLESSSQTYPNRRFFMGGVDTMRGYREDAMIPADLVREIRSNPDLGPADVLRGGDAFFLARGELRFPIVGPLYAGIFADLGNLWAQARELDPTEVRPNVGAGLRVQTPVLPIVLDLGFNPVRRRTLNEQLVAFHFSIVLF